MKTCKICGCSFDEENCEGVVVNEGMDSEYFVCCDCVPDECNNGHIISCENCGSYFSPDKLHDEHIGVLLLLNARLVGKMWWNVYHEKSLRKSISFLNTPSLSKWAIILVDM